MSPGRAARYRCRRSGRRARARARCASSPSSSSGRRPQTAATDGISRSPRRSPRRRSSARPRRSPRPGRPPCPGSSAASGHGRCRWRRFRFGRRPRGGGGVGGPPPSRPRAVRLAGSSDRALSLTALHRVWLRARPIDELVEGLEREGDGHRKVLDLLLEARDPGALDERVELLAIGALALVQAQPALDRLGDALGGQPGAQPVPVEHLAALVVAAEMGDIGGDLALADLQGGPVEANVRDVMLRAAVRAAGHLDVDPLGERIGDAHRLHADRKSTRLNSSHTVISYAVFCLKKKKKKIAEIKTQKKNNKYSIKI